VRDVLDAAVAGDAEHLLVFGIDGEQLALEAGLQHVADDDGAEGISVRWRR
jgi:hypothetical protein